MKSLKTITLLAFALTTVPAHAGFEVVKPQPPAARPTVAPLPQGLAAIRYIGSPTGEIELRTGFGRDVKEAEALKQIVPKGWHAQLKQSLVGHFDPDRLVSWHGGKPWVQVLDVALSEQGLSADIDWDKQIVFVGDRADFIASRGDIPAAGAMTSKPPAVAAPAKPKVPVWQAVAGNTLKDVMAAWAKSENWTLRWEPADLNYAIVAPLRYEGSYEQAAISVISAFSTADRPLFVCLYTQQHLTRVTESRCTTQESRP
ncbi:MAG: hypothetical protein EPN79_15880 [Burkholderiaceae bacterium]|nr:MAG: hypothetical protein EPN79_15880 [Burkholderiaceae bacterium]